MINKNIKIKLNFSYWILSFGQNVKLYSSRVQNSRDKITKMFFITRSFDRFMFDLSNTTILDYKDF